MVIKPKKQKQKAKCYKPLSHLEKAKLCWCYFAPALFSPVSQQAGTRYSLTCVATKLGKIKVCSPPCQFKDLIKFQISVLLSCGEGAESRARVCLGQTPLIAWHPPRARRLFSVSPSSLRSINFPVPFNRRKTSLICASGSLVTGNWILQISLSAKEQDARILNLIYNTSVFQVYLLMVISCREIPRLAKSDNIWEESGPYLNVKTHTHPFFFSVFSSVCGSTLC